MGNKKYFNGIDTSNIEINKVYHSYDDFAKSLGIRRRKSMDMDDFKRYINTLFEFRNDVNKTPICPIKCNHDIRFSIVESKSSCVVETDIFIDVVYNLDYSMRGISKEKELDGYLDSRSVGLSTWGLVDRLVDNNIVFLERYCKESANAIINHPYIWGFIIPEIAYQFSKYGVHLVGLKDEILSIKYPDTVRNFNIGKEIFKANYLRNIKYSVYTKTKYWIDLSKHIKERDNMTCQSCGNKFENINDLHAHHKSYDNLGIFCLEKDDLESLCKECHFSLHKKGK